MQRMTLDTQVGCSITKKNISYAKNDNFKKSQKWPFCIGYSKEKLSKMAYFRAKILGKKISRKKSLGTYKEHSIKKNAEKKHQTCKADNFPSWSKRLSETPNNRKMATFPS